MSNHQPSTAISRESFPLTRICVPPCSRLSHEPDGSKVVFQFCDKEYTKCDLVKIAKDVWQYDLKKDVAALKDIELYVKPEECKVYYVMNGETGSFDI